MLMFSKYNVYHVNKLSLAFSLTGMGKPDDGGKLLVVLSFRAHQLARQKVAADFPSLDLTAKNQIGPHILSRITQR